MAAVGDGQSAVAQAVAFGDTTQPHHAEAAAIVLETEHAVADTLVRTGSGDPEAAAIKARLISGAMLMTLAGAGDASNEEIVQHLRQGVSLLVRP